MEALPSREVMKKNGVWNKISKIYRPTDPNTQFKTIQEAKDYFLTTEAQELFRYCCEEHYKLTEDKNGLHWTIAFGEPDNQMPGMIKWADKWKDGKQRLHNENNWFNNFPNIEHDAEYLF